MIPENYPVEIPREASFEEESGYLVLRLERDFGALPVERVKYKEKVFEPKEELHITILSQESAEKVKAYLEAHPERKAEILRIIQETDWSFQRQAEFYHIVEQPDVETVIQMAAVPGISEFFTRMSEVIGEKLESPPTHITLFTRGTSMGIGLPNTKLLKELVHEPVRPKDLEPERRS